MPPKKRKCTAGERCIRCNRLLRYDTGKQKSISSDDDVHLYTKLLGKRVEKGDVLCHLCRSAIAKSRTVSPSTSSDSDPEENLQLDFNPEENPLPNVNPEENPLPDVDREQNSVDPVERHSSTLSNLTVSDDTEQSSEQSSQQLSRSESGSSTGQSSQSSKDPPYVLRPREPDYEMIEMPFNRVTATHKCCCVCLTPITTSPVVPFKARLQVFISSRIFIPKGNRCCPVHLISERMYVDEISNLKIFSNTCTISSQELALFLDALSKKCDNSILDRVDDYNLSAERIKSLTGYTVAEIKTLKNMLVTLRNSQNRSINQALLIFLFKLRTGNSNTITASIFDIKSEQLVSAYCKSVLDSFAKDVFPLRFGARACSREDLIANHTSPYVKKLHGFEDRLLLIADGSYLRHQKSSNNCYQKKSFSGQKKCPLCKPFTVCATDGYVIDVYGPYEAIVNDAKILQHVLSDPNGLRSILKKGDVFILDRGFRDVKDWLESQGFVVLMPALKGKRKQLPTNEANESRFVTKLRWVVEAVHGIIGSKFKLLHNQFNNNMLDSAMLYCKVANFLVNEFGKRLNCDTDLQDQIAEQMLKRKDVDNSLAKVVEEQNWNRKKRIFKPLTSNDVLDFPEMTEQDLKILFTGSYQLSQTVSYLAEMYTEEGLLNMQYLLEDDTILKCEVKSRHINKKVYRCYVQYDPNSIGYNGIKNYVCDCANGLRTVGCCAHVATIIYFLSHARYLSKIIRPAQILTNLFHVDNVEPVIEEHSDED